MPGGHAKIKEIFMPLKLRINYVEKSRELTASQLMLRLLIPVNCQYIYSSTSRYETIPVRFCRVLYCAILYRPKNIHLVR